ncbi:MAG: VOC family protein [Pseudomonadota bacterium]
MDEPVLHGATIVPVRDVARSMRFYVEVLGFSVDFMRDDGGFAIVRRGPVGVQLTQTDDIGALEATANNIAIYITVRNLDAFYTALAPNLASLPEGRLRPPFNQPYGMREFHVKCPDGCLLFFASDGKAA